MTHEDPSTTLECGRDLLDLVEQVTDGTPAADAAHQADCQYCQEALCRIRTANRQLRDLAGERIQVPRGLSRRVMAQLRRERGRVSLATGPAGSDTLSDLVILQIVRRATRSVDGVIQCSVALAPVAVDGDLSLTIHVTAVLGPPLATLAEQIRRTVAAELRSLTGLQPGLVTVEIDDVEVVLATRAGPTIQVSSASQIDRRTFPSVSGQTVSSPPQRRGNGTSRQGAPSTCLQPIPARRPTPRRARI